MKKRTLCAVAVLLLGFGASLHAQNRQVVDGVVAVVGQTIIKNSDIEQAYAQVRLRQGIEGAHQERCSLLESMLISKLLVHKGIVDSVEVSDDEVEDQVDRYLKMAVQQAGGKDRLRDVFHYSYDELHDQYFDVLHDRMLSQKVEMQLTSNVKITPAEVIEFFNAYDVDSLPEIADQYEVSEIVVQPTISEAERDRVRGELAELRERILKGDRFSMLAKLYSEDPGSASKGGELGFFGRGDMVTEFEAAAFALKPGEVSPIIETQYGFHILQLIERRGNTVNVRHILMQPKTSSEDLLRARIMLDSLAQEIRQGHITFEDAAKKYSDGVSKNQGGAVTNPALGNGRFDKETFSKLYPGVGIVAMEEGEVSNATAILTMEGKSAYCLIKLTKKIPAHTANLTDDYDRIYNAALESAKTKKIVDWCNRMVRTTYIRIADEYKDCPNFEVNWPR
ncbi:MAG: peptidylprolyl isomerase [Bacteroidales bacterium]|nr:peptidylprolyl isomerase [Bacteroidales bacterium]